MIKVPLPLENGGRQSLLVKPRKALTIRRPSRKNVDRDVEKEKVKEGRGGTAGAP